MPLGPFHPRPPIRSTRTGRPTHDAKQRQNNARGLVGSPALSVCESGAKAQPQAARTELLACRRYVQAHRPLHSEPPNEHLDCSHHDGPWALCSAQTSLSAGAVWAVLALPHSSAAGLQIKAASVATLGRMPEYDRVWSDIEDAGQDLPSMAAVLAEAVLQPLNEVAV